MSATDASFYILVDMATRQVVDAVEIPADAEYPAEQAAGYFIGRVDSTRQMFVRVGGQPPLVLREGVDP